MTKVVACIVARTVSTRLPLKVLRDLVPGMTMLDFIIKNIQLNASVDQIYLCTSTAPQDDILVDIAERNNIKIYRGSAEDVTERLLSVAHQEQADILVRITGDNPFSSVEYITSQVGFLQERNLDYVRMDKLPIGAGCEVFTTRALEKCVSDMDRSVSEYLMLFMFQPQKFRCGVMHIVGQDFGNHSLTVDMPADLERTKSILSHLNFTNDFKGIKLKHILKVISENTDLPAIKYEPSGDVKLPYGKVIPFTAFKADMNERINLSFHKGIDE